MENRLVTYRSLFGAGVDRALALAVGLFGLFLFWLGQAHLTADIFVLKAGPFWSEQAASSVVLARLAAYGFVILLPALLMLLRNDGLGSLLSDGRFLFFAGALALLSVPWALVFHAGPIPPVSALIKDVLRDAFTRPLALICAAYGLMWRRPVLGEDRSTKPGTPAQGFGVGPLQPRRLFWVLGAALLFTLLQPLWRGPAYPRLEDEAAFHLQSLIFGDGKLSMPLLLPDFFRRNPTELLPAPWVLFESGRFYSAHLHGWSAVLAVSSWLGVKGWATAIISLANILTFYLILQRYFAKQAAEFRLLALAAFVAVPVVVVLGNTLMSHTLALFLSLCCLTCWLEMDHAGGLWSRVAAGLGLICLAALYALVRLQSLVPLLMAFVLADLIGRRGTGDGPWQIGGRVSAVVLAGAAAWGATMAYGSLLGPGQSPVFMARYMEAYLVPNCQALGFGPGFGCFPTYGTMGHSLRKSVLNALDIAWRLNQEAAAFGLPILLFVFPNLLKRFLRLSREFRMALLLLAGHSALFALYFHYGGESYRGRYLADIAFVPALLLGLAISGTQASPEVLASTRARGAARLFVRLVPSLTLFALSGAVLFSIKPDYFQAYVAPVRNLASQTQPPARGSLLIVTHAPDVAIPGGMRLPSEFGKEPVVIEADRVHRFLNTGTSTALASAVGFDAHGLPEDAFGNILLGAAAGDQTDQWLRFLGRKTAWQTVYSSAQPGAVRRGILRVWQPAKIELKPVRATQ